jgi:hypothetical protein
MMELFLLNLTLLLPLLKARERCSIAMPSDIPTTSAFISILNIFEDADIVLSIRKARAVG